MQLTIADITKGYLPSSLNTAKFDAFECTPKTNFENLVNILSNSFFPLNVTSNLG